MIQLVQRIAAGLMVCIAVLGTILTIPVRAFASPCSWSTFSTPNGSTSANELFDIAAVSATDAIAVGLSKNATTFAPHALVLAFGGAPLSWKIVPVTTPGTGSALAAVRPFSSSGAWLAGLYATSSVPELALAGKLVSGTYTTLPAPTPGIASALTGVESLSSTSAIFVGGFNNSSNITQNYARKWTGTTFVDLHPPNSATVNSIFTDIKSVPGTSDVAVSGYRADSDGDVVPFVYVLHLLTGVWATPTGLDPSTNGANFFGLAAVSSSQIWAAGALKNGTTQLPMIQKFNDSTLKFALQTLPALSVTTAVLNRVAARSSTSALAVGTTGNSSPTSKPLAFKWDGTAWTNQSPTFSNPSQFFGIAAVPGTTNYFVAGTQLTFALRTLIAKASCP